MADNGNGRSKKISINQRPRSGNKSQSRVSQRKQAPSTNVVIFADPARNHASTNFPLFSSNLVAKKPAILQGKIRSDETKPTKQSVSVNHNAKPPKIRAKAIPSPTPVEQTVLKSDAPISQTSRSVIAKQTSANDIIPVAGSAFPIGYTEEMRSAASTPISENMDFQDCCEKGVFPIQFLPDDCLLKIFSFLLSHDKARCSQVCVRWCGLMRTPGLWAHVAFSDLPFWCITTEEHNCVGNCYIRYRVRVKQFFAFLKELRPILRSIEFKFDIGEQADGFLQPLENLIASANTKELRCAHMNWRNTPARPFWTDMAKNVRCDEVMQKHRFRQRLFVGFFDMFTQRCPNVETLVIPFDWSDRSVDCMLRLKNLRSLVLEKYFVFQKLCQDLIDRLLLGLPCLQQLMLEVWTPSGHGLLFFALVSKTLEYLDISQSRGFYLNAIHLPKLTTLRIARHPWNGPLVLADRVNVPCIYNVLCEGAPNLKKINEHYLEETWKEVGNQKLEEVLKNVCSCRKHKSGWAM